MTVNGKEGDAINIISGLTKFVEWMKNFSNVILLAHNGSKFDFPVLMSTLHCLNMTDTLFPVVSGFIDSLSVYRKTFPEQQNYKQETPVKAVLNTSYAAHDATEDVKTLGLLMKQTKLSGPEVL